MDVSTPVVSGLEIRRMRPDDLGSALAILDHWNMAPRARSADQPDVEREHLDPETTLVAECDQVVVGVASFVVLSAQTAETASLAVAPEVRGTGIGYRLQQARLRWMRDLGIRTVRTETDRPETIVWYVERFGYRIVGTVPKKHSFSRTDIDEWTILEIDL